MEATAPTTCSRKVTNFRVRKTQTQKSPDEKMWVVFNEKLEVRF